MEPPTQNRRYECFRGREQAAPREHRRRPRHRSAQLSELDSTVRGPCACSSLAAKFSTPPAWLSSAIVFSSPRTYGALVFAELQKCGTRRSWGPRIGVPSSRPRAGVPPGWGSTFGVNASPTWIRDRHLNCRPSAVDRRVPCWRQPSARRKSEHYRATIARPLFMRVFGPLTVRGTVAVRLRSPADRARQPDVLRATIRRGDISVRVRPNLRIPGFRGRIAAARDERRHDHLRAPAREEE